MFQHLKTNITHRLDPQFVPSSQFLAELDLHKTKFTSAYITNISKVKTRSAKKNVH